MDKKYKVVVTEYCAKLILLYMHGDDVIEIQSYSENDTYKVGDIYLGEVFNKKDNIDSSFINISKDKTGYLKGTDNKNGRLIPVMIKKITSADKQDIVTEALSIPGVYNVVFKDKVIKRTNAQFADENSITNERAYLQSIMDSIYDVSKMRTKGTKLYDARSKLISDIFSLRFDMLDEIITDIEFVYSSLIEFIDEYSSNNISINIPVVLYDDKMVSLSALYSIKSKLTEAIDRKVYLRSGAYLYIEPTSAMTVIDVNTGSTSFKGEKADTFHKVNLEAAKEIVHQLRLRNLSGIIIVDFINTNNSEYEAELIEFLNSELKTDNRKAKCHGLTKLSLVEITRNRVNAPLHEQLKGINN